MCLLHLIYGLYPEQHEFLHVIHFNHGLRGEASDLDEALVRKIAGELDLPFLSTMANDLSDRSEAHLRKVRLEYIHSQMAQHGAKVLLQGHQLDDIAETTLMRLSRGSTVTGLAAPRPVQHLQQFGFFHVRPLLTVGRSLIQESLKATGFDWREDESNQESMYYRNQIRHQLLPVWEQLSPQPLLLSIAKSRQFLEEDDHALEEWAKTEFAKLIDSDPCILKWPSGLPVAILRRVLFQWVLRNQLPTSILSPTVFSKALHWIEQKDSCQITLSPSLHLVLNPEQSILNLKFESSDKPKTWPITSFLPGCCLYLPNRRKLHFEIVQMNPQILSDLKSGRVDESKNAWLQLSPELQHSLPMLIRQRRAGDQYQPLGMKEPVRLQNLLVNKKIPAPQRDHLPIITTTDDKILWCPGCPPAEAHKITDPNTQAIRISYLMA